MKAPIRSFLFVPGDSERKLQKSLESKADALIFDLEDSVLPARKAAARERVAEHLASHQNPGPRRWVRVNPVASGLGLEDLERVGQCPIDGIVLPKAEGPQDVAAISNRLDEMGADQSVLILPVVTETARAALTLHRYLETSLPRLYGMTWGAEDLSAELGAAGNRDSDGQFALTYRMVRSQALLTTRALNGEAVDTVYTDYRDLDGLRADSLRSFHEGFSGRMAIHPNQVAVINQSYSPSEDEVAWAQRVVDAFESDPEAGTIGLDGKMLDRPHLAQAQRTLALSRLRGS
jgi:citrate lyase subunit beta/citryl-CoA lyase